MANKSCIWIAAGISLLAIASTAAAQDEQWLQYRTARQAREIMGDMGLQHSNLSGDKPEGTG